MSARELADQNRFLSIDALRGMAMFLILAIDIGGAPVLPALFSLAGKNFGADQFSYGFTEGLRLCFIAMPMFLFIVGIVIPFSLSRRKSRGSGIYFNIIRRSVILFILGLIAGGHLLHFEFSKMPLYNNVLEYIGVGYLICSVIVLNTKWSFQLILASMLLIVYWLIFLLIPVPGWDGATFSSEMNLAIYIDNVVLGPFHKAGSWQVLATISFIANMLLGVLAGQLLASKIDQKRKVFLLAIAGIAMIISGTLWGHFFPVIRSLWTSTFVLVTCGMTTVLLAILYYYIDMLGHRKWAFFFIVFGANSIAIYMMAHMFDFRLIGNILVGGLSSFFRPEISNFIQAMGAMAVMWLIMYYMYIKKTFIKI